jgi:ribonuclease HII
MGPLLVTGVLGICHPSLSEILTPAPAITTPLGDSKVLVSFRDSRLGETWARALLARNGAKPDCPHDALLALLLETPEELRAPCPPDHLDLCWATDNEAFEASDHQVDQAQRDLDGLAQSGLEIESAHAMMVCTSRLNTALTEGRSRLLEDLHAMERLIVDARTRCKQDLVATCGKVGGFDRYGPHFGPLGGHLRTAVEEGRALSRYRIAGIGEVSFVRNAEANHPLVALASLIGKWIRDFFMRRIIRYHRSVDRSLPMASGYQDPVTARFLSQSASSRLARGVPDRCVERRTARSCSR